MGSAGGRRRVPQDAGEPRNGIEPPRGRRHDHPAHREQVPKVGVPQVPPLVPPSHQVDEIADLEAVHAQQLRDVLGHQHRARIDGSGAGEQAEVERAGRCGRRLDPFGDGIGAVQVAVERAVGPELPRVEPQIGADHQRQCDHPLSGREAATEARPHQAGGGGERDRARHGAEHDVGPSNWPALCERAGHVSEHACYGKQREDACGNEPGSYMGLTGGSFGSPLESLDPERREACDHEHDHEIRHAGCPHLLDVRHHGPP